MAKVDLHCHSFYSEHPSEWFLQRLGAKESYTEPEVVYKELIKKGMDFVTITDHNRIEGALKLKKKHPGKVIVGLEATAYFPEDNCKIHILVYGLNEIQFEKIQRIRTNIYELRDYLKAENLAHSVAHATYSVNGKLKQEHVEKLLLLFDVFEGVNGGRNDLHNKSWIKIISNLTKEQIQELQQKYDIEPFSESPWIKGVTGGSDDHAGIFLGMTYTESKAKTLAEFLDDIRNKKTTSHGRHNNYQGLAFAVYKIAMDFAKTKSTGFSSSVFGKLSEYIYSDSSLSLIHKMKIKNMSRSSRNQDDQLKRSIAELVETLQKGKYKDIDSRLNVAYEKISDFVDSFFMVLFESFEENMAQGNLLKIIRNLSSSLPGIFMTLPFFTTISHIFANRDLLNNLNKKFNIETTNDDKNVLWFTDTIGDLNGVAATLSKVHEISKNHKYGIRVISSDLNKTEDSNYIDLPVIYEFKLPYYEHQSIKFPSLLLAMKKIYDANPSRIIVSTPGPFGLLALLASKLFNIECVGVYHTDFTAQAEGVKGDESLISFVDSFTHWFYQQMDMNYVPSQAYIDILEDRGFDRTKMKIFPRGIEYDKFYPVKYGREFLKDQFNLQDGKYFLYTGRISHDKDLVLVLEAFKNILETRNDFYLILIGDGPHKEELENLYANGNIIFTGRLDRSLLPNYYSGADLFLFPSRTDTFGMSVLEAQACCLPALVSSVGGPKEIIVDGETGYIIKENTIESWQNKMQELIEKMDNDRDFALDLRENSRKNVVNKSNWNLFFKEFVN
ncbi:MAG: glycosyltransferase [Candidatus Cloacimonetes bacterium]|nr:glycosyltransferase [Candidatus Cloacimonadota bacterium]MCF7814030.1 glycosyltransferase [Candidatus Cloacimonadota bacterium]MCF7868066.1 glycosyltransferase [Candidatus Cloacimonadota bacterium]MCF7883489.1 glycosyltransferase [Candidatus Cloacimonadota bacterium]